MEKENRITLSFIDKSIAVSTVGNKTYATIKSGFKFTKFDAYFHQFGFKSLPEVVVDTLNKYGYKRDLKTGMWVTKTNGIAVCAPEDTNVETTGQRIALMRAKAKAYEKSFRCIAEVWKQFNDVSRLFLETTLDLEDFIGDEYDAIDRVIETGKSDFIE